MQRPATDATSAAATSATSAPSVGSGAFGTRLLDAFTVGGGARGLVQRKADGSEPPRSTPDETFARATSAGGTEIPYRAQLERAFGQSFAGVRAHLGQAGPMKELSARAATQGENIAFATASPDVHLVAHEVAHVVQNRARGNQTMAAQSGVSHPGDASESEADAIAARSMAGEPVGPVTAQPAGIARAADDGFADVYKTRSKSDSEKKVRSHLGVDYGTYKNSIGPTQSALSGGNGQPIWGDVTTDELLEVFRGVADDVDQGTVEREKIDGYVDRLNQAFRLLRIDTVEAQASYIANAWNESDQFRYMTETSKAAKSAPYTDKPEDAKLDEDWLNRAASRKADEAAGRPVKNDVKNTVDYEPGGSINTGNWEHSFIGRGPIQVTHRHYYIQAIAVLENRAEELEAKKDQLTDQETADLKDLREAITQIKEDPAQASNTKYAFMFSAAFMKMPGEGKNPERGDEKASRGRVTDWMGKQPADAAAKKQKAYANAYKVLKQRADEERKSVDEAEKA